MLNNNGTPSISQKHQHSSPQPAIDRSQHRHNRRLLLAHSPHTTRNTVETRYSRAFSDRLPLQREYSGDVITEQRHHATEHSACIHTDKALMRALEK